MPCDHGIVGGYDYHAHIIYSDDHGETWHLGGSVPDNTTSECQVVELSNGALMLNIRNHDASPERKKIADNDFTWADRTKDPYRRTIALSFDGGLTWNNVRKDPTLLDPHCQASLLHHADSGSLIFSNPASTTRRRMTVRLSDDEGKTWTSSKLLHAGPSAYSCLTILPHGILGCLYERGDTAPYEKITLARFTLEWAKTPPMSMPPRGHSIPLIDLSQEPQRQVIVEKQPDQYLGHPTTVLLSDGRTILCTYPLGHGGPSAVLKKSTDGGLTWSERLSVPDNWKTARNCPCLHRLTDADGVERLFVIEGNGDMRQAVSQDNGVTWTPFEPNGLHCVVAPITI
ncbi:MAG: exo-alpha-sialidase, partial [Pseudomonadales bacterium]